MVDVSGIGKIDPAGAAEWRNFMMLTNRAAERIFLVGCPPVLLERLTREGDLGEQVISFAMPYSCSKCATTASQCRRRAALRRLEVRDAAGDEVRDCKSPTTCAASESLLSRLRTLPRVDIDSGLRKFVKEMRDRKPVQPQQPKQPGAAGARLGMFTGLIVLALVAAAILIGVNWYQTREARETQKKIENVLGKVWRAARARCSATSPARSGSPPTPRCRRSAPTT